MRTLLIVLSAAALFWPRAASADDAVPVVEVPAAAPIEPYDSPPPAAAPLAPPPAPARDAEAPRGAPRPSVAASSTQDPEPSEAGLVAVETLVAHLTTVAYGWLAVGGVGEGPGLALFALGPAVTGTIVCGFGSMSELYESRCGYAIGGAYIGALALFPGAMIGAAAASDSGDGWGKLGGLLGGAAIGYIVGTSVGAVIGWNAGRDPKGVRRVARADLARLDALAASRGAVWREPPRRRGPEPPASVQLAMPLLSLRF